MSPDSHLSRVLTGQEPVDERIETFFIPFWAGGRSRKSAPVAVWEPAPCHSEDYA